MFLHALIHKEVMKTFCLNVSKKKKKKVVGAEAEAGFLALLTI